MAPKEGSAMETAAAEADSWQCGCGEVRARLSEMRTRGLWADCELAAGAAGERVPAHRVLLASASPVLAAMLYGSLPAPQDQPLALPDIQPDDARLLIEYIYTDNISISSCDVACSLYRAAHYLIMPHLETVCRTYLVSNVTPQCVLRVYEFAQLFDDNELMEKCLTMMSRNSSAVLAAVGTAAAPRADTLARLFARPDLRVRSELELLQAAERWASRQQSAAGAAQEDARTQIRPALQQIRFLAMEPDEFAQHDMSSLLSQSEILAISLNLLSKKSHIPMPAGFSTTRVRRRDMGTIKVTIPVINDKLKDVKTEYIHLEKRTWSLYIDNTGVYLKQGDGSLRKRVKANIRLKIYSHEKDGKDYESQDIQYSFNDDYFHRIHWEDLMSRKELLDPKNGYLHDGAITLEVQIEVYPISFLRVKAEHINISVVNHDEMAAESAAPAKKEESEPDEDMGFGLFN